jgi:hypothetical protein
LAGWNGAARGLDIRSCCHDERNNCGDNFFPCCGTNGDQFECGVEFYFDGEELCWCFCST